MLEFIKNPKERTRFLKFCFVGCFGAVVDFGVGTLMRHLTHNDILSSAIAFVAAVISNFIWNRYWTYPDSRQKPLLKQLGQFFLVNTIGLGIRVLLYATIENPIIKLCGNILPADFAIKPADLGYYITWVIAVVIVMIWNFFANRFWTYNDVD
jgi:putative flippase GtrA